MRSIARPLRSFAAVRTALRVPGLGLKQARVFASDAKDAPVRKMRDIETPVLARVGQAAPYFEGTALMPDGTFANINLDQFKGKDLLLFSFPLAFTFVCPTEIIDFSERAAEFKKINCEVVAFSVDSEFAQLAWTEVPRNKGGLGKVNIPLLTDKTHQIHRDYGCLNPTEGDNPRGMYYIDSKGILKHITMNHPEVGRSVDEALRLVQAYQFAAKNGVVCPSGWKPGSATIVTNPKDKLEFFSKKF